MIEIAQQWNFVYRACQIKLRITFDTTGSASDPEAERFRFQEAVHKMGCHKPEKSSQFYRKIRKERSRNLLELQAPGTF